MAATLTTCVSANMVAPANGFTNVSPTKISYKRGVLITMFISFFVLQAWWIYGSGNEAYLIWLNAYGSVLAPLAAIFIADYFICKHRRIDVAGLFKGADGRYWYSNGFNPAAIISWAAAFVLPLFTYFGMDGSFWEIINSVSYIWSFIIGFILYVLLMQTKMGKSSYVTSEEHESFTERIL